MNTMKWFLGFALAMVFSVAAHAQTVQGVMMVVKGDIKVTGTDGKTEAGKVGKKVSAGDTILAGPDSRAKIVMADKNVINVSPDSKIVIEKYENDGKDKKNVELNVVYGKVRASVEQKYDGDKSKFNVKTPSAVAGVRGTDFLMGYSAQTKTAQVITFTGSVAVGQPGPGGTIKNPVFVQAGQMTQAGAGKAPEKPKSLPKEDLNKMNNETKADTASNGKKDSGQGTSNAKNDGDGKKDSKDNGGGDSKREPASVGGGASSTDSGKGGGSMINTGDLGPVGPSAPNPTSGGGGPNGPPPPQFHNVCTTCLPPPPPPPPPVKATKSTVNIILNPK